MEVTVLGCGTSTGVPLIGCKCNVCKSREPRNRRLRASLWLQVGGRSLLIDTSTDLRQQALRERIGRVDAVLYTHPHADHVGGIDEMRAYNFIQGESIPVFGNRWTCEELGSRFPYIFDPGPVEGGGIPRLELNPVSARSRSFRAAGIAVVPIALRHGSQECLGFRIENFAYLTDFNVISESSLSRLEGVKTLVLDCLRIKPHPTHLNMERALELVERLAPKRTYLTHMGHEIEYRSWSKKLPKGVFLAYDGLKFRT